MTSGVRLDLRQGSSLEGKVIGGSVSVKVRLGLRQEVLREGKTNGGSVSVRVQQEHVYLHPGLEFWTWIITNGDHTDTFGCLDSWALTETISGAIRNPYTRRTTECKREIVTPV